MKTLGPSVVGLISDHDGLRNNSNKLVVSALNDVASKLWIPRPFVIAQIAPKDLLCPADIKFFYSRLSAETDVLNETSLWIEVHNPERYSRINRHSLWKGVQLTMGD